MTVRRIEGDDSFGMGLVAGGRQLRAIVDGWPSEGYATGFDFLDKKKVLFNPTRVNGALLKSNKDHTILFSVRSEKLEISVNGKAITSYKGEFVRLSLPPYLRVPNEKALFLVIAPKTSYQIDRAVLTPVKGKGTILK